MGSSFNGFIDNRIAKTKPQLINGLRAGYKIVDDYIIPVESKADSSFTVFVGNYMFVASGGILTISVLDATNTAYIVIKSITITPTSTITDMIVTPDGKKVYLSSYVGTTYCLIEYDVQLNTFITRYVNVK